MRWDVTGALDPVAGMLAKEQIRDLAHRYHLYSEGGRAAEQEELFTAEAVMEIVWPDRTETFAGRDEVMSIFRWAGEKVGAQGGTPSTGRRYARHHLTTHQIDLQDATSATGRWYFAVVVPDGLDHWGRYLDRYRCDGGVWRFAHRRVQVEGLVPGSAFNR